MRYLALATDYDGTLAHHGRVAPRTIEALEQLAATGRRLVLVTSRELDDLLGIFPEIERFHLVVAENGALVYDPATRERKVIAPAPHAAFVAELERRGVAPLSVGASIVATVHPNETVVLEVIRDLGLELQVIFNRGAVMVLPASINKATGLQAALEKLGLSPHNVVAVGDAENDHALLDLVEYSATVANAAPMLKAHADRTLDRPHGEGVVELIESMLANDLATPAQSSRHQVLLGTRGTGEEVGMPTAGVNVLVAGTSGSGKSTLATGVLERLAKLAYQFCVIDPEGDYEDFPDAIALGGADRAPGADEVLTALEKVGTNVVINLIALPLADRPRFFSSLLPGLQALRAKTGRPHWVLVDETHHLLPTDWEPPSAVLARDLTGMIYVTVHPEWIAPEVLASIDVVTALGVSPEKTIASFCRAARIDPPAMPRAKLDPGEAVAWLRSTGEPPFKLKVAPSRSDRRRHRRKYAAGELPPDRSFYFRGPEGKLNLRAQNLMLFQQIADGVDDETWRHHLRAGDYSAWIRGCIKDQTLAALVSAVEEDDGLAADESRRRVKVAIEEHYTLPEEGIAKAVIPS
jgi:hydroxymethylpyrimidine pyrophosphatase-like HAD family hydrolase